MGNLSLDELRSAVADGQLDTVLACIVDMQGRLMGKRFHGRHFVDGAYAETHCCNYLLATDMDMNTVDGYAATGWDGGYGDYIMKPDLETLRRAPWLEGTALVLCDVLDHETHGPVAHSPRALLKQQVSCFHALGYEPLMATELEFFLFRGRSEEIRESGFQNLKPVGDYNEDYSILQTSKEEVVMRPLRNHLFSAGIPVENSKGEAAAGQEELNIKYGPALGCADHHSIAKHAVKEIAWQAGYSASFLAKWNAEASGSATHVHQSLGGVDGNAFVDPTTPSHMSDLMRHYLAGLITYARDYTYFLAPYINSYKRFVRETFAPTSLAWSADNRTAGFRICDMGGANMRIECRIGGADLNPYLAQAAMLAAGFAGIDEKLELGPAMDGNLYESKDAAQVPSTLREALAALDESAMLRKAFGDAVIDHYVRTGAWEQEKYDRAVTDYELRQGFEQA